MERNLEMEAVIMNKKTTLIVLPLLVLAIGLLAGCIRGATGDSHDARR